MATLRERLSMLKLLFNRLQLINPQTWLIAGTVLAVMAAAGVLVHKTNQACENRLELAKVKERINEGEQARRIDEAVRNSTDAQLIKRVYIIPPGKPNR
jgi:hypothetical protein